MIRLVLVFSRYQWPSAIAWTIQRLDYEACPIYLQPTEESCGEKYLALDDGTVTLFG